MRLTLRTLLAYLDDILEDGDANALKAKIDESGIATSLIARIKNSVDKRELGAISPDAIGPLENANVMSEYLDSTLSPEQVTEIERLCLESDTSLSEAAACHQILTVVLGQPAQVSDRLRQRVYKLPGSDELRAMERESQPAADTHTAKPVVKAGPVTYSGIEIPPATSRKASASATNKSNYSLANASAADLDRGAADFERDAATAIRPVGPKDSGVSNASSRIRKSSDADDDSGRSEAEIVAGTTRALMGRTEGYGGGIRPSRITPWLVALCLAGVLLYALAQVFSPLTEQDIRGDGAVAMKGDDKNTKAKTAVEPKLDAAKPPASADELASAKIADSNPASDQASSSRDRDTSSTTDAAKTLSNPPVQENVPSGDAVTSPPETEASSANTEDASSTGPSALKSADVEPSKSEPFSTSSPDTSSSDTLRSDSSILGMDSDDAADITAADLNLKTADEGEALPTDMVLEPTSTLGDDLDLGALTPDQGTPDEPTAAGSAPAVTEVTQTPVVAEMTQAGNLVIVRQGDLWKRLTVREPKPEPESESESESKPESESEIESEAVVEVDPKPTPPTPAAPAKPMLTTASVSAGETIVAPALFRPTLVSPGGVEWTLAGPTRMRIGQNESFAAVTQILDGRILLASTKANVTTMLVLGQRQIKVAMPESQTVLAIELSHFRPLGANPLVPGNRLPTYRVISVQGTVMIQAVPIAGNPNPGASNTLTLEPNQQYQGKGIQPAAISAVDRLPVWIDADAKKDVLADSARDGLMQFATRDEAIEKSLREAMTFRRVEVAALAAETLLLLGRADVYFGGDGILNRPRQRLYWQEHVDLLRQQIASDAQAADAVRVAIERAELADSKTLFKLLVGFTPEELQAGADAELVELLDSPSMAVRVLAIENLREIVGDTIGYRADQENANARKSDIKKWETRLRRGDIRYQP